MIIKVPEFGGKADQNPEIQLGHKPYTSHPGSHPTSIRQVAAQEAAVLATAINPATRIELQKSVELRNREHFVNTCLNPLLKAGFLEMTIPDKPRSSRQKYRLTDARKRLLVSMQHKAG